jgi:hypothetical protein
LLEKSESPVLLFIAMAMVAIKPCGSCAHTRKEFFCE